MASITTIKAVNDASRFMVLENVLARMNKYFGTYTFLISGPLSIIADIEQVVTSE